MTLRVLGEYLGGATISAWVSVLVADLVTFGGQGSFCSDNETFRSSVQSISLLLDFWCASGATKVIGLNPPAASPATLAPALLKCAEMFLLN